SRRCPKARGAVLRRRLRGPSCRPWRRPMSLRSPLVRGPATANREEIGRADNPVAGPPRGVVAQMAPVCGEPHHLLALLCQPAEVLGTVAIPDELAVWGIDSGIRHAVSVADYTSVRVGAFMGYRILQTLAGTDWQGYLANLTPSEFEQLYASQLPEQMSGAEFLER